MRGKFIPHFSRRTGARRSSLLRQLGRSGQRLCSSAGTRTAWSRETRRRAALRNPFCCSPYRHDAACMTGRSKKCASSARSRATRPDTSAAHQTASTSRSGAHGAPPPSGPSRAAQRRAARFLGDGNLPRVRSGRRRQGRRHPPPRRRPQLPAGGGHDAAEVRSVPAHLEQGASAAASADPSPECVISPQRSRLSPRPCVLSQHLSLSPHRRPGTARLPLRPRMMPTRFA